MNAPLDPKSTSHSWPVPRQATWATSRVAMSALAVAAIAVCLLYGLHTWNASRLIDGVRWFWMDDDMMISMRYARNLVEGNGLVFNPGERVEGYTNFGWVLLMAAVHLLPLSDQLMPVAMRAVSAAVCLAMLFTAARLVERIEPKLLSLTLPVVLILVLSCYDIMFWAVSGFETILVTLLHLLIVLRAISGRPVDAAVLLPLALLPLVRSDGLAIWLGDAFLVFWIAGDRRRTALVLATTLLPFFGHLLFRLVYYGDLLPNTYYLKLDGLDDRFWRGLAYVQGFAEHYALVLVLAAATIAGLWKHDVRARSLATSVVPAVLYAWYVGGDSFGSFRFFAHIIPELFVWSVVGAVRMVGTGWARAGWLLAPVVVLALPSIADPVHQLVPVGQNGDPRHQIVVAAQLLNNASADASVAVVPAGIVPYFSRLHSVDLLGKTDAHIARLPPREGAFIGHGKLDPAYSFGKRPDYVVSARPDSFSTGMRRPPDEGPGYSHYVDEILASSDFQRLYKPHPVPDPYLMTFTAVYVRAGSQELETLESWWGVYLDQ